jgi:hypothetical protein
VKNGHGRVLAKKSFSGLEVWLHYLDPEKPPPVQFFGTPVYSEKGEILLYFITFTDITRQRMLRNGCSTPSKKRTMC